MKILLNNISVAVIFLLVLPVSSFALQANFEKAGVGRVVGDSAQELLDQLKSADLILRHGTYVSDISPYAESSNKIRDKENLFKNYFDNATLMSDMNNLPAFDKAEVDKFQKNELLVIEAKGGIKNEKVVASNWVWKPEDKFYNYNYLVDKFKDVKPLFIFDSDYAGLYLPTFGGFVSQLGQDSIIVSPTAIPDREFVRSFICYLGMNNLAGNNSVGEIFRDARNAYYWQNNAPSGLSLMSYELYGNPQMRALLNNVDKQDLLENCAPYIQEDKTAKISSLSVAGMSPSSLHENYVLENLLVITNYTLENDGNFTIISVGGMQQGRVIDDVILPRKVDIEEFPLKTLISNVSVVSLENPAELIINLSMWNGTDSTERACWFDKRPAGITYTHTFTEDAELAITHIKPVEIVNCTEGRVKLYQTVKYKIEYNPFSSVLIKKIEAPPEVLPDSIAAINVTVRNLRTRAVSGLLSVSGNNNTISSIPIALNPYEVKTIQITFKTDKSVASYAVNYIEDNEIKTSKKFRIVPRVLDLEISALPYQASGLLVPVGLSFNNRLSQPMNIEFDISLVDSTGMNYKPLHLPMALLPGRNTKFVKLETDVPAGTYSLLLSVSHPYGTSIVTKTVEIVSVDYNAAAGTVNTFSDGSTEKKTATSVTVPRDVVIKNANIVLSGYPSAVYNLYPVDITLYVGNLSAARIYGKLIGNEANLDQFTNGKSSETVSSAEAPEVIRYLKIMKTSDLKNAAIDIGQSLGSSSAENEKNFTPFKTNNYPDNTPPNATPQNGTVEGMTAANLSVAGECSLSGYQQCYNNGEGLTLSIDQYNQNNFHWDWLDNNVKCTDPYILVGEKYRMKYTFFDDYSGNAKVEYGSQELWSGDPPRFGSNSPYWYEPTQTSADKTNQFYWKGMRIEHDNGASVWHNAHYLHWSCSDPEDLYLHVIECAKDSECSDDKSCNKVGGYGSSTQWKCDTPSCPNLNCPEWKEQVNTYSNHACNSVCNLKPGRCETPGQELDETHYCDSNHYIQSGAKKIVKVNGVQVWTGFGIKQENLDITSKAKEFLSSCAADSEGYCSVPVQFTSSLANWDMKINSVAAKYIPTIEISDTIQNYLSACDENPCQVPISTISYMSGTLTFLNPVIQYESYNYKPVVDLNSEVEVSEGEAANLNLRVLDMAGENFTVTISRPFNNSDVWQTNYDSAGTYDVNVQVQDSAYIVQKSAKVKVKNVNRPPKLMFVDDIQVAEKENVTLAVDVSDLDGDELTYSVSDPRFVGKSAIADNFERADIKPWIARQINDGARIEIKDSALNIRTDDNGPNIPTVAVLYLPPLSANFNFSMKFKNIYGTLSGPFFKIGDNNTGKWIGIRTSRTTFLHLFEGGVETLDDFYDDWNILINGEGVFTTKYTYDTSIWHTIQINKNGTSYIVLLDNVTLWSGNGDNFETVNYVSVENGQGSGKWPMQTEVHYDDMRLYFPDKIKPANLQSLSEIVDNNTFTWQTQEGDAGNYTVNVAVSDGKNTVSQNVLVTVNAMPAIPSEYWGIAAINDSLAQNGTAIEAYINGTLFAAMDGGTLDGFYDVIIPADDPDTPEKEGGKENEIVVIKINGSVAKPFLEWIAGVHQADIRVNRAPVVGNIGNVAVSETEVVQLTPSAADPDNDSVAFFYSTPLNESGAWQTDYNSAGEYDVNVTASDGIDNAMQTVKIIVRNLNRPPLLAPIDNITVNESGIVQIIPSASDPDGGELVFSFTLPLNSNGTWKTTFNDAGIYVAVVTVNDSELTASQNVTITVLNVNLPSFFNNTFKNMTVHENQTVALELKPVNPDGDKTELEVLMGILETPQKYANVSIFGAAFNNETFTWTPSFEQANNYSLRIDLLEYFSPTEGIMHREKIVIQVLNTNVAPVLNLINGQTVAENVTLVIILNATDPDGGALMYSTNAVKGSLANNTYTWHTTFEDAGVYHFNFSVSDGSLSDNQTAKIIVLNVDRPPEIEPIENKTVGENSILEFFIRANDADGQAVELSAENLPPGAELQTFVSAAPLPYEQRLFRWQPNFEQSGLYNVTFVAKSSIDMNDPENNKILNDSKTIFITVNNVNRAPALSLIGNKIVSENQSLVFAVAAVDPDNDTLTYLAHNLSFGAAFVNQTFSWAPTFEQSGNYSITFETSDGSLNDTETIAIHVTNANRRPEISDVPAIDALKEGESGNFSVVATDPDGDTLFYKWYLNGNVVSDNLIFEYSPNFNSSGQHNITVKVSDGYLEVGYSFMQTVINVNRAPVISSVTPENTSLIINENSSLLFNHSSSDPDGDAMFYSWQFDGKEVSKAKEWLYYASYDDAGMHNVTLTISDGSLTSYQYWNLTVSNVNRAPAIVALMPASGSVFNETDVVSVVVSASDPDNDTLAYSIKIDGKEVSTNSSHKWSTGYEDAGMHRIEATASDSILSDRRENVIAINNMIKSFSLPLAEEWNLISVPITPLKASVKDALFSIDGNYSSVFAFAGNEWKSYDPQKPEFLNSLKSINETFGFWIYVKANGALHLYGTTPETAVSMRKGWNLVGYPYGASMETGAALGSINGKYSYVLAYDAASKGWKTYVPARPAFLNSLKNMSPGAGYWVSTVSDGLWKIGQRAFSGTDFETEFVSQSTNGQSLLPPSEYWGSVTINASPVVDGTQVSAYVNGTLYANMPGGTMNGFYSIILPADNPDTPEKEGGLTGDTIMFRINGSAARPLVKWKSGVQRTDIRQNIVPEIISIGEKSISENKTLQFIVIVTDDDNVTVAAYGLPHGSSFINNEFSWVPGFDQSGIYQITFNASDGDSYDEETVKITVDNVNRPPVITSTPAATAMEEKPYSYRVEVVDEDMSAKTGDGLAFSMVQAPENMAIDGVTGLISWVPANEQAAKSHAVTIRVTDSNGSYALQAYEVYAENVNDAPVLNTVGSKTVNEGELLEFDIIAHDPDPVNDALVYSAHNLPKGAAFENQVFSWTPGPGQVGAYSVYFEVNDGKLSDAETILIKVSKKADLSANSIASSYTSYSLDFGAAYTYINKVCYEFTLSRDLLDPGEKLQYTMVPAPASNSYGFVNSKNESQSTLSTCITPSHPGYTEFLDGKVAGSVWMESGTASIANLVISLEAAVKNETANNPAPRPSPPSPPAPSCFLSADRYSGVVPFSSAITVNYSNLITEPETITISCGSTAAGCIGTAGSCSAICNHSNAESAASVISASIGSTACSPVCMKNNPPNVPAMGIVDACLAGNSISSGYTSYSLDFGSSHAYTNRICYEFILGNDLLDPGEKLQYTMVPAPASNSYGFVNSKNESQSTLSTCITPTHPGYTEFLDGKVAGSVWMESGTASIKSMVVRLENS